MLQIFLFFVVGLGTTVSNVAAEPTTIAATDKNNRQTSRRAAEKTAKKKANVEKKTDEVSMSPFRYVVGGLLSGFPGFGLGHAVQGRWLKDYGWVFTAGELATLTVASQLDEYCSVSSSNYEHCQEREEEYSNIQGYLFTAFAVIKIAEIISAWWPTRLTTLQGSTERDTDLFAIPRKHYLTGGFIGTFVGFGLGHAVQGRWWSAGKGWVYTLTQLPLIPIAIAYSHDRRECRQRADEREREGGYWSCDSPAYETLVVTSALMFVISRIVEAFDVWDIDPDWEQVVERKKQKSLFVLPYTDTRSFGLQLAYSY